MKTRAIVLPATLALGLLWAILNPTDARAVLVSANSITNNANVVGVFFDPAVTLPSATNITNYVVYNKNGALPISSVSLQTNGQYAVITLLGTNVGEFFYVDVTNIVDVATNSVAGNVMCYLRDVGNDDIGTVGDPSPAGEVFSARGDTFQITASGSDIGGTDDHFRFLYQDAAGNFDMAVRVTRLDPTDALSKAGLMAREALTTGSQTIQTYVTPTAGSDEVEVAVRDTTNGTTTDTGFQIGPRAPASGNQWLRLTRIGDVFTAYHGSNGLSWAVSGITTQAFSTNLFLGMAVTSRTNGATTTAEFRGFDAYCARPGDEIIPSLSASISGTNLVLNWPRTPRDFTVQISTNTTYWEYLLAPIYETGTNATGRKMLVPLDIYPTNRIYARLTRAERVIPDPPLALQTGIILALGNCSIYNIAQPMLCSQSVIDAVALDRIVAAPNRKIALSTVDSSAELDTVMSGVMFYPYQSPCDDDAAGNKKSKVEFITANTSTVISTVIAVKPSTQTTTTSQIRLKMVVE